MNNIKDQSTRDGLLSLVVVCVVVGLILAIYMFTDNIDLVNKFLQSTAEGNISGIAFIAGGPFGMWVIAFLLINRFSKEEILLGSIKLNLVFSGNYPVSPPSQRADYNQADCWYTVFSNGNPVIQRENVNIQFKDISPYIIVNAQDIKNPEFQVKIAYGGHQFISDSFSPIKREGSVRLS